MSEEVKVRSKTEEFKVELQAVASQVLGTKVSKQAAWDLFKGLVKAPYSFMLKAYEAAGKPEITKTGKVKELELPLSGVGTFKIIPVGKEDALSVKGRWYLSSTIESTIKKALGFADDVDGADEVAEEVAVEADAVETDAVETVGSFSDIDVEL